jgi:hypothetical protein
MKRTFFKKSNVIESKNINGYEILGELGKGGFA